MTPKPRPDFLGLMDVMQRRADEIKAIRERYPDCKHEDYRVIALSFNKDMIWCECLTCGMKFWASVLESARME